MSKSARQHRVGSKWTALAPRERDKHFVAVRIFRAEAKPNAPQFAELQAIISKRSRNVPVQQLEDATQWARGWR